MILDKFFLKYEGGVKLTPQDKTTLKKSSNIRVNDKAEEIVKELFDLLENRHQNNLESMKGSEFVFNCVHLMYYKCHKINPNRGGSYIDFPDWIKIKKQQLISSIKKIANVFNSL